MHSHILLSPGRMDFETAVDRDVTLVVVRSHHARMCAVQAIPKSEPD